MHLGPPEALKFDIVSFHKNCKCHDRSLQALLIHIDGEKMN